MAYYRLGGDDVNVLRSAMAIAVVAAVAASGCSSGATPTTPPTSAPPTDPPTATRAAPTLDAPAEVAAGSEFEVSWTGGGGENSGDYIAILATGATKMTDDAEYVNISHGPPGKLTAPTTPGGYELIYIVGDTLDQILARRPITVK